MAAAARDVCSFPLVLLDCARATSTIERRRNSFGLQKSFPQEAYAAVAGDLYFLTKREGVSAPSALSHFFKRTTLRIKCERMADDESLESVGRRVYMDGGLLVVSAGGCSGKAAPGSDDDEVYCISLFGASANPEWLRALHASIQLALMPAKAFVDVFLRRPLSDDVAALQASLQCTLSVLSSEVMNPREEDVGWVETANRMSCRAGLLGSHIGWVSNVGTGIAGIESGANVVDAVARGLSSVAVVGSAFAVVSVLAKGVTLAGESAALKRDFQSLYKGLQETAKQLLGVIIRTVSRGLRDEKVVANMVGALAEAWSISQNLERRIWKRTLGSVVRGESANEFRDKLENRHDALRNLVASYHSDNAIWDKVDDIRTRLDVALTRRDDPFVQVFRGFTCNLDVVEEALPGLAELKQSVLADSQVAVSGCRRQVVGTKGEGGVGKTTACSLLCNDPAVKARFPDGIHFLQFGLESSDEQVLSLLCNTLDYAGGRQTAERVRTRFGDDPGDGDPLSDATDSMKEWFAGRRVLFVCDNVSHRVNPSSKRRQPLPKLLQSMVADAPQACLLLTTRYADIAQAVPKIIAFDRLDDLEAAEAVTGAQALIERYAGEHAMDCAKNDARQGEARDMLIEMCGGWQLLLCVCGRMVRESYGDWTEVSGLVEKDRGLLLRARPDEEDADPALGAVLGSSLGLLDTAPDRKAQAGISISAIRGEFGERCFGHLYSVFGILGDVRYVPSRLLRALFAAVRTLAKKSQRSADSDTGRETGFPGMCLVACKFLEVYGLVDVIRNEGDYAVRLHDSKFHYCEDLFRTDDLWSSMNPCRVHYEFVREIALSGVSRSTALRNVNWASICGTLAGRGEGTRLGWEPNLVYHLVTAAGLYMARKAVDSDSIVGRSDAATAVRAKSDIDRVALAGSAEDDTHVSHECANVVGTGHENKCSEEAFEWLMGLVTDFRWVRARALLDGRRGVYQDLLTVFSGICEPCGCRGGRDEVVEARGVDPFCDDDVNSSHHLKGELAALKILRWVIVAADEGCFGISAQRFAAHKMGGIVLCSEVVGKCIGFESLLMWKCLRSAARGRGQALVRQFVESAETNVEGPWWKPVLRRGGELAELSQTQTRFFTSEARHAHGLGEHCGLVTSEGTDSSELTLSDEIRGCPVKNRISMRGGLRVLTACVLQGTHDGDVVAAIDEGRRMLLWNTFRDRSPHARLIAKVNVAGRDTDAEALGQPRGMCIGRGGKVIAVYNKNRVFVWGERQADGDVEHVFRGTLGTGLTGRIKRVQVSKNGQVIVVLHNDCTGTDVICFKDVDEGEYTEAWRIENHQKVDEHVIDVAVTSDSSCIYTLARGGRLSRVDVASGSHRAFGRSMKHGDHLVLLKDDGRWRIVGAVDRTVVEWWTDMGDITGKALFRRWRGELAEEKALELHVRWVGVGSGSGRSSLIGRSGDSSLSGRSGGSGSSCVFETHTSHDDGVWRIRRWGVGADGCVSPLLARRIPFTPCAAAGYASTAARVSNVKQFAISSVRDMILAVEWGGDVSVLSARIGMRMRLQTDKSSAVDVSADGSIAVSALRGRGSVEVWDVHWERRLVVLAGNDREVTSLLLCDSGGSGGSRLLVVAADWGRPYYASADAWRRAGEDPLRNVKRSMLRVGDCHTGQWLCEVKSGEIQIDSLGYAALHSCARDGEERSVAAKGGIQIDSLGYAAPHSRARDGEERSVAASAPVVPVAGAEPSMHAWIASMSPDGQTILWQLSCDGKLTRNPTQPAESEYEERAFTNVFSRDELSIQGWHQVPCGYSGVAAAGGIQSAPSVGHINATYSRGGSCWRIAHGDSPSLADSSYPSFVLNSTQNKFAFVNMPLRNYYPGASELAAVTVDTDSQLQIWHLRTRDN